MIKLFYTFHEMILINSIPEDFILPYNLTQGSLLYGIRSAKYPEVCCYGIIVSARCDLANCKIPKFYFLTALKIEDWLMTDEGFRTIFLQRKKEIESILKERTSQDGLSWDVLRSMSFEEFRTIINDSEVGIQNNELKLKYEQDFLKYLHYDSRELSNEQKKALVIREKKIIADYLLRISTGGIAHYCLIPQSAYRKEGFKNDGIVIDLQELQQLLVEDAEKIQACQMDCKSQYLSTSDIDLLNERFFLKEPPGFVIAEYNMESPWIEYLMQNFANAFIRIGVDGLRKKEISEFLDKFNIEEDVAI